MIEYSKNILKIINNYITKFNYLSLILFYFYLKKFLIIYPTQPRYYRTFLYILYIT